MGSCSGHCFTVPILRGGMWRRVLGSSDSRPPGAGWATRNRPEPCDSHSRAGARVGKGGPLRRLLVLAAARRNLS